MKRSSFHIDDILIEKLTKNRNKTDDFLQSNLHLKFSRNVDLQSQRLDVAGDKYFINQNALNSLINMTRFQIQNMNESFRCGLETINHELMSFYTNRISHKKRRKSRTTFSNYQVRELEKHFQKQKYLTPLDRDKLALELNLSNNQVITWFQNRRAKLKREVEELHRDLKEAHKIKDIPN